MNMRWTEPEFEEIQLSCEINAYACAELPKPFYMGASAKEG